MVGCLPVGRLGRLVAGGPMYSKFWKDLLGACASYYFLVLTSGKLAIISETYSFLRSKATRIRMTLSCCLATTSSYLYFLFTIYPSLLQCKCTKSRAASNSQNLEQLLEKRLQLSKSSKTPSIHVGAGETRKIIPLWNSHSMH